MRKNQMVLFFVIAIIFMASSLPVSAASTADATEKLDITKTCSLDIVYSVDGILLDNIEVEIYPIATVSEEIQYTLCPAFSESNVYIENIKSSDEWEEIAYTLYSYATANNIASITSTTATDGKAHFSELDCGLYLVNKIVKEDENNKYIFYPYVIALPNVGEDGKWEYDIQSYPKSIEQVPFEPSTDITYTVFKTWKDAGATNNRPNSVEIELYKDGSLVEHVKLSSENDWTYKWTTSDVNSEWIVVERNIAQGYHVSISQTDTVYTICNISEGQEESPQTGDTSNVRVYFITMLISGFVLIILVISGKRRKSVL